MAEKFKKPKRESGESSYDYQLRVGKERYQWQKQQRKATPNRAKGAEAAKKTGRFGQGSSAGYATPQTSGYELVPCGSCNGYGRLTSSDGQSVIRCPSCSGTKVVYRKRRR